MQAGHAYLPFAVYRTRTLAFNTSTNTADTVPVADGVTAVRLVPTGSGRCYVSMNAPATTSGTGDIFVMARPEIILVRPGDIINVISTGVGGTLSITELTR